MNNLPKPLFLRYVVTEDQRSDMGFDYRIEFRRNYLDIVRKIVRRFYMKRIIIRV